MPKESTNQTSDDYDSPWKEALERYFPAFLAFFFSAIHDDIDWSRGYEFLDKELQQVVREADLGRRLVDKLVKVWRKSGEEAWVLIHIEVQGQVDEEFPERMYVYNYRLFDRYRHQVASLGVLCDARKDWRPDHFGYDLWTCQISLRFPIVKLLDYNTRWAELEMSANPFAVIVMAHLKTQATQRRSKSRLQWKLQIVKGLYERRYSREDVLELLRFIDWMMRLPADLETNFNQAMREYEEKKKMPYVTSWERRGIEKGLHEAVLGVLESRFEQVPEAIQQEIDAIEDAAILKTLVRQAVKVESLEAFHKSLTRTRTPSP